MWHWSLWNFSTKPFFFLLFPKPLRWSHCVRRETRGTIERACEECRKWNWSDIWRLNEGNRRRQQQIITFPLFLTLRWRLKPRACDCQDFENQRPFTGAWHQRKRDALKMILKMCWIIIAMLLFWLIFFFKEKYKKWSQTCLSNKNISPVKTGWPCSVWHTGERSWQIHVGWNSRSLSCLLTGKMSRQTVVFVLP